MRGDCRERLVIQMCTVYEHAWMNLKETLQVLADMGYCGIEYYGRCSILDRNVTAQMEARTEMKMIDWHTEWVDFQEDTYEETVSCLEAVGCPLIVVPCLGGDWNIGHSRERECRDVWLRHLDWLNQLYGKLSARGLGLAYHDHNHEFLLNYGRQKIFELLSNNLGPEIMMEFDTGRATCAGEDCCQTLHQYGFRGALLHLKPCSSITGYESFLGRPDDCSNVREIFRAYEGNFDWIMLESGGRAVDEMESTKEDFRYLDLILGDVQELYIGVLILFFYTHDVRDIFRRFILREYIRERAVAIANYIIDYNATVRQTAKKFGIGKSTVYKDVVDHLGDINPPLAARTRVVLDVNKSEHHIRDGMATKEEHQHGLQVCSNDKERQVTSGHRDAR